MARPGGPATGWWSVWTSPYAKPLFQRYYRRRSTRAPSFSSRIERTVTRNEDLERELSAVLPWWKKLLVNTECRGQICQRVPYLGRWSPARWVLEPAEEDAIPYEVESQSGGFDGYMQLEPRQRR